MTGTKRFIHNSHSIASISCRQITISISAAESRSWKSVYDIRLFFLLLTLFLSLSVVNPCQVNFESYSLHFACINLPLRPLLPSAVNLFFGLSLSLIKCISGLPKCVPRAKFFSRSARAASTKYGRILSSLSVVARKIVPRIALQERRTDFFGPSTRIFNFVAE